MNLSYVFRTRIVSFSNDIYCARISLNDFKNRRKL